MALDKNFKEQITDKINSYVSAEKMNMANAIFDRQHDIGDFSSKHNIITGVVNGNMIPIITKGNRYGMLKASKGDCSMNECDLETTYSSKKWVVGDYDCRIPICMDSYSEDFLRFWGAYKTTLEDPSEVPTYKAYLDWLVSYTKESVEGALWLKAYWGDTTSVNELISLNNGFWTEAKAGDGIKINMGDPATPLTGEAIYKFLQSAYEQTIDEVWYTEEDMVFVMSHKMARTLVSFLNTKADLSKYNCDCLDVDAITGKRRFSIANLTVFGIPVVAYKEVDMASIQGLGVDADFRALLINKENLLIGINTEKHLNQFNMFYDQKDRKIYIDLKIQIGASIPEVESYTFLYQEA